METEFFLKEEMFCLKKHPAKSALRSQDFVVLIPQAQDTGVWWKLCCMTQGRALDLLGIVLLSYLKKSAVDLFRNALCSFSLLFVCFRPVEGTGVNPVWNRHHTHVKTGVQERHLNQSTHPGNPDVGGELWNLVRLQNSGVRVASTWCLGGTEALSSNWASY